VGVLLNIASSMEFCELIPVRLYLFVTSRLHFHNGNYSLPSVKTNSFFHKNLFSIFFVLQNQILVMAEFQDTT